MGEKRFQSVATELVVEKVFRELRTAIFNGLLKPDEDLKVIELAQEFDVSQATIREALVMLENRGLVVRVAHRGTKVRNLSKKEVEERIAVRVPLEALAFWLAARTFSAEEFRKLTALAQEIRVDASDPVADLNFHEYIWTRAGNGVLMETLESVSCCLFGFANVMRAARLQNDKDRLESHLALISALERGARAVNDPDCEAKKTAQEAIYLAVRGHLDSAYKRFLEGPDPDFKSLCEKGRATR